MQEYKLSAVRLSAAGAIGGRGEGAGELDTVLRVPGSRWGLLILLLPRLLPLLTPLLSLQAQRGSGRMRMQTRLRAELQLRWRGSRARFRP